MSRYFYYLRHARVGRNFLLFFVCVVILVGVGFSPLATKETIIRDIDSYYSVSGFNSYFFHIYGFIFFGLCFLTPIFMFSYTMKRNAFEKEQLLPVSKRQILISRYIWGYVEISIVYFFATLVSLLVVLGVNNALAYYGIGLVLCLYILLVGILPYSYFSFFFLRGRNMLDGVVLMLLAFFAPLLIGNGISYICLMIANGRNLEGYCLDYYPFQVFEWDIIKVEDMVDSTSNIVNYSWAGFALAFIYQALATFGFFYKLNEYTVEGANQKTVSLFGYRLLIPLTFIPMILLRSIIGTPIFYFFGPLVILFTYLIYALSYRNFVFNKKQLIIFSVVAAVEFILYVILLFV